jgi:hypothetical protein
MDTHMILALFHILFVAPLFFVIAFFQNKMPDWAYTAILGLGIFLIIYQSYKYVLRLSQKSGYAWINLFHMIIVAPLLLYIGYRRQETPRFAYELCIMVGFAALGYHTYSAIKMLQVADDE